MYLYLIELSIFTDEVNTERAIKIGFTKNFKERYSNYKHSYPTVIYLIRHKDAKEYETKFIQTFNECFIKKQGNEYFELQPNKMIDIIINNINFLYLEYQFNYYISDDTHLNKIIQEDNFTNDKLIKISSISSSSKYYICEYCSKELSTKQNLENHINKCNSYASKNIIVIIIIL